ncbi:uncharacterized protein FA14DRAFT_183887 [Meira miltonrushii]|uniref:MRPL25 domain-containing protein n=1 Tax=Meira miltonrushii TaxID=1280837 RepID=A0A316VMJ7_9BASI|nr:uncharacterized protein FA14DRAFT_183887 [Meira miltonrushii]PWN38530.1 hypothetical protein FA14DRAFT_183887 [Meira miltonrushii]
MYTMWSHVVLILVGFCAVVSTMDKDPFAGLKKDLSLSPDSVSTIDKDPFAGLKKDLSLSPDSTDSPAVPQSRWKESEITSGKKKWIAPPGYYTSEKKDARMLAGLKRKNPTLSEEEVQQLFKTKKENKWKYPQDHFRKDIFIERIKQKILKKNPEVQPDAAEKDATGKYTDYMKQKSIVMRKQRVAMKKAKEYVKSIDGDLAKTMRVRVSNKKVDWIARKTRWLKKTNKSLTKSDAEEEAHNQFAEKRKKEALRKRKQKSEALQIKPKPSND